MNTVEVTKIPLPASSALHKRCTPGDFLDCYGVTATMPARDAAVIITDFPYWARFLLLIRRIVTAPFGLDNNGPAVADRVGIFPVESETAYELIAGFDDKHLDFRVSVLSRNDKVSLATWVRPHNFSGRAYLTAIMPFHIAIARNALERVRQTALEARTASFRSKAGMASARHRFSNW